MSQPFAPAPKMIDQLARAYNLGLDHAEQMIAASPAEEQPQQQAVVGELLVNELALALIELGCAPFDTPDWIITVVHRAAQLRSQVKFIEEAEPAGHA